MDFLKEILGNELFNQFTAKVNEYNGNEANKDKQIKLANLASGEYVGKGKHDALTEQLAGKQTELDAANNLIAELKKASKGNEDLQGKFAAYEAENAKLKEELQETKINSAVKVALLSENVEDVEYVAYKLTEALKEKGEKLELDEADNIKGWTDKLNGLKTQLPNQFKKSGNGDEYVPVENNGLPKGTETQVVTKEEFAKMGYKSRVELKNSNPELYSKLTN